jgi:hypothetical protein
MLLPEQLGAMRLGCRYDAARVKRFAPALVAAEPVPGAWGSTDARRVAGHNDICGDCVPTAYANAIARFRALRGDLTPISDDLPVAVYEQVGGFKPGVPGTDNGLDPVAFFAWAMKNPVAGCILAGWHDIDPSDELAVRRAIINYGSVFQVQRLDTAQFNQLVWTPVGGPLAGYHATCMPSFAGSLTFGVSWGEDKAVDRPFYAPKTGQVLDVYALDIRLAA